MSWCSVVGNAARASRQGETNEGRIMRALVLAAGKATRLGAAAAGIPKPMIELCGEPIIASSLAMLRRAGVRDVVINLHHNPEAVVAGLGDGSAFGVRLSWSRERSLRGTGGALDAARPLLGGGQFLVLYGDNRFRGDLLPLLRHHQASGAITTIASLWRGDVRESGELVVNDSGHVLAVREKPPGPPRPGWVNAGIVVAEAQLFEYVTDVAVSDLVGDVLRAAVEAGEYVRAEPFAGEVYWIDTPADLARERLRLAAPGRQTS